MRRAARSLCVLSLVLPLALGAPGSAHAAAAAPSDFRRYFDAALLLYKTMDFERSLEQLRLAKLQPHSADEDVVASLYEGILRFELGDEAGSASAFRAALFLSPNAVMPVAVSPRITLTLERERTRLRQKAPVSEPQPVPVAIQARPLDVPAVATTTTTTTTQATPLSQPQLQPQPQYWTAPPSAREEAPPEPRPVQVVVARESLAVPPSTTAATAAAARAPERRLWAIAPLAVGAVALGVGGFCLVQTSYYYDALNVGTPTRAQADTYRSSGKTYQAVGWSLAAAGAGVAVAGAVLLALPVRRDAAPVALSPFAGPSSAGLALSGSLP